MDTFIFTVIVSGITLITALVIFLLARNYFILWTDLTWLIPLFITVVLTGIALEVYNQHAYKTETLTYTKNQLTVVRVAEQYISITTNDGKNIVTSEIKAYLKADKIDSLRYYNTYSRSDRLIHSAYTLYFAN